MHDLDGMPFQMKVSGFKNERLNQAFCVDENCSLHDAPLYWSEDTLYFMYKSVAAQRWRISPSVEDQRQLLYAVRWGAEPAVAREEQEGWQELGLAGTWAAVDVQCICLFEDQVGDTRQPQTPPE
ncbi:unnamed protein product [Effrenium voratum]|uniref:Uncharacterized protein n=1 Tax=Effrenium voratum TaxID=2562239 RepID=A0AA36JIK0_9DINO|nr:unnamed protein product [Effrenium voratum]